MADRIRLADLQVGDFVTEFLVTDSRSWVVVGKTAKSVTAVPAVDTDISEKDQRVPGPWPVIYTAVAAPAKWGKADVRRFFDTGSGLSFPGGSKFLPALTHVFADGVTRPVRKTDYRF
jgi:hypothetical protein